MNNIFTSKQSNNFNSINTSLSGTFSSNNNNNNQFGDLFANMNSVNINQEDDEHCCEVIYDEKIELSQIKEAENESQSGTESAFKSRKKIKLIQKKWKKFLENKTNIDYYYFSFKKIISPKEKTINSSINLIKSFKDEEIIIKEYNNINDNNMNNNLIKLRKKFIFYITQRWSDYVANGHGGNKELKEIVKEKGFDYVKNNFQYSILENYNARMDDDYIRKRENWWKDTLCSKEWGYNDN